MTKKTELHTQVSVPVGMRDLLLDPKITTDIAHAYESFERVMLQVQRELAGSKDDELTLQVAKGLYHLDTVLKGFVAEGQADFQAAGS